MDRSASLPSAELLRAQAAWLAPIRARLLRRVAIARRRCMLDLGAGSGAVTGELVRRGGGSVVAFDLNFDALREEAQYFVEAARVRGTAVRLPFAANEFDLVFCQCALLWMPLTPTLDEVSRVLRTGGVLVAIEPDYGGMIEHPPESAVRDIWIAALTRAGADPFVGRKLPGLLGRCGFDLRIDLLPEMLPPSTDRFGLLRGLPLTEAESAALREIEQGEPNGIGRWDRVVHLPFCLVTATKGAPVRSASNP